MLRNARTIATIAATAFAAGLLTLTAAVAPSGAGVIGFELYGALGTTATTSDLYSINSATGDETAIGPIGFAVTGLAIDPTDGTLYGSTSNNSDASPGSLITIDPETGDGTLVGSLGVGSQTAADLAFDASGTLYGLIEASSDDLVTIDTATGAATFVGDAGFSSYGSGIDYDADRDAMLWAADGLNGSFRSIDLGDGSSTELFPLGGADANAVAALDTGCDGALWGVNLNTDEAARPASLITIDRADGTVQQGAATVDRLDAIAANCSTPLSVVVEPTGDREVATFDWFVEGGPCIAGTTGEVLDEEGNPVDGATVTVNDPSSGTVELGASVAASYYGLAISCVTADGNRRGVGDLAFARGTVVKAVEGTPPAGAAYTVAIACDEPDGESDEPYADEVDFGAEGGTFSFILYAGAVCTVEETDDGGADETTQTADSMSFVEDPVDRLVTVTNSFGARAAPPATPTPAAPTFTG